MKNKFTLTGTDNDGFRHRYSFKKNEKFKIVFAEFMEKLGFDKSKVLNSFITNEQNAKGEEIEYRIKIKDLIDICRHYQNKINEIDVFYGKEKIIILVRSKKRRPFVEYLENKSDWIKPLEIKKIKERKKKKINLPLQKIKK